MESQRFKKGDPLTAARLNPLVETSKRVAGAPGAPGGSILSDKAPVFGIRVTVIARLVSVPAVIEEHGYVVTDGANNYPIEWNQIILPVQPSLVGPDHDPGVLPQGFVPAEIAGQERAVTEWWRAWGVLYRGPSPAGDGETVAAVELFGISPHRGC